jgi:hypothetical protein
MTGHPAARGGALGLVIGLVIGLLLVLVPLGWALVRDGSWTLLDVALVAAPVLLGLDALAGGLLRLGHDRTVRPPTPAEAALVTGPAWRCELPLTGHRFVPLRDPEGTGTLARVCRRCGPRTHARPRRIGDRADIDLGRFADE